MCNPIMQAKLLEEAGTEINIVVGLCVGHDSLFYKYSKAPTTTLITKDRVMMHNPAAALYGAEGYYSHKLAQIKKKVEEEEARHRPQESDPDEPAGK